MAEVFSTIKKPTKNNLIFGGQRWAIENNSLFLMTTKMSPKIKLFSVAWPKIVENNYGC
jgi:hypothetical protein